MSTSDANAHDEGARQMFWWHVRTLGSRVVADVLDVFHAGPPELIASARDAVKSNTIATDPQVLVKVAELPDESRVAADRALSVCRDQPELIDFLLDCGWWPNLIGELRLELRSRHG